MQKGKIARHKAAIRRPDLSLPAKCLIRDGLLTREFGYFDYGCGHGQDLEQLANDGYTCDGWDPVFRPNGQRVSAEVVTLGYVLNVIEDVEERASTLTASWKLATKVLCVSARILVGGFDGEVTEFGDGILTKIGTFQKYYTQAELREYIERELGADALPAAPGVFYVFRDEDLRRQFVAARYRRRLAAPRKRISEIRYEQNQDVLEPLMDTITELGRLPERNEFDLADEVIERFGSLKRAFSLIRRVTGPEDWEAVRTSRSEDLLVYLALSRFPCRSRFSEQSERVRRDIREFFGTYKRSCEIADELLFSAGDADVIDAACQKVNIGRLTSNALLLHQSALDSLSPVLRVYEGCARAYLGEIDTSNVVKLHRFSGKVSYLSCPEFDTSPHPPIKRTVKLSLRSLRLDCYENNEDENLLLLDRKESMVSSEYVLRDKFSRLTVQEEKHGLLVDEADLFSKPMWTSRLEVLGFRHRGHRLVRNRG